jgi:hypothetical protein
MTSLCIFIDISTSQVTCNLGVSLIGDFQANVASLQAAKPPTRENVSPGYSVLQIKAEDDLQIKVLKCGSKEKVSTFALFLVLHLNPRHLLLTSSS